MTRRVLLGPLKEFVADAFRSCGVPARDADNAAQALCYADAVGIESHGVANLERLYVSQLLDGAIDPHARPQTVRAASAAILLDGVGGLGLATACAATEIAIELAHKHGVGLVSVRGSSHFGSAGYYALKAADAGCIGIAMSNCGVQRIVPAPCGGEPVLGTNPIAIAVPAYEQPHFVLDMSTTVVSTGRVRGAAAKGQRLPAGILARLDGSPEPEADPAAYDDGRARLLWLGSHVETGAYKGFGLGLAVDLLCGLLSGAGCGPFGDIGESARDIGHFILVIDVSCFCDNSTADFLARCDLLLAAVLQAGGACASYPGVPEAAERQRREYDGIPMDAPLQAMFERVAQRCGITTSGLYAQ